MSISSLLPFVLAAQVLSVTYASQAALEEAALTDCFLFDNGGVKCLGFNLYGQLSYGDNISRPFEDYEEGNSTETVPFIDFGTNASAVHLSTGTGHICVVFNNGRVKCMGLNSYGQLGQGDTQNRGDSPGAVARMPFIDLGNNTHAIQVATGEAHTCVLLDSGRVKCFGQGVMGYLGIGETKDRGDRRDSMGDSLPYLDFGTTAKVVQIDAASTETCVLFEDGRVKCFGCNSWVHKLSYTGSCSLFQGNATIIGDEVGEVAQHDFLRLNTRLRVVSMDLAYYGYCFVLEDGSIRCLLGNSPHFGQGWDWRIKYDKDGYLSGIDMSYEGYPNNKLGYQLPIQVRSRFSASGVDSRGDLLRDHDQQHYPGGTCAIFKNGKLMCTLRYFNDSDVVDIDLGTDSKPISIGNDCVTFSNGKVKCGLGKQFVAISYSVFNRVDPVLPSLSDVPFLELGGVVVSHDKSTSLDLNLPPTTWAPTTVQLPVTEIIGRLASQIANGVASVKVTQEELAQLHENGIESIDDVREASDEVLIKIFGPNKMWDFKTALGIYPPIETMPEAVIIVVSVLGAFCVVLVGIRIVVRCPPPCPSCLCYSRKTATPKTAKNIDASAERSFNHSQAVTLQ